MATFPRQATGGVLQVSLLFLRCAFLIDSAAGATQRFEDAARDFARSV